MTRLFPILPGVILALTATSLACPFCGGPPTQAWSELLAESDVVVLAKLISVDVGDSDQTPKSTVRLRRIHKGKSRFRAGSTLVVDEYLDGEPGSLFILLGSVTKTPPDEFKDTFASPQDGTPTEAVRQASVSSTDLKPDESAKVLRWDLNEQLDEATFDYIAATPHREIEAAERLRYYVRYLESNNDIISIDAFSEFAAASYQDVASLRDELDPEQLRAWITDPQTSPDRLGMYGMMLGLCGSEQDARFLKQQIGLPVNDDIRFGVDGLMGGLLLLSGRDGLEFIRKTRIQNTNASALEAMAAKNALEFIYTCEPDMFPQTELASSLHGFVQREDMRELALSQLSRWQDWSLIGQLPDVYQASVADEDMGSVRAVVGYLLALKKSCTPDGDDADKHVAAVTLLDQIRDENPRLVRQIERFVD